MIDSFEMLKTKIAADTTRKDMALEPGQYALVTLHRPSNVDDKATLQAIVEQLVAVATKIPLVLPIHPRTRKQAEKFGFLNDIEQAPGISLIAPIAYIQFMNLVRDAKLLITDSGGIQEETSYLHIPCLTLRDNTERPVTIEMGTNKLLQPSELAGQVDNVLSGDWPRGQTIPLWDGKTAARVSASLRRRTTNTR